MIITQEPKFQPISIKIETNDQALALWALVETWQEPLNAKPIDADIKGLCDQISRFFSNIAQVDHK